MILRTYLFNARKTAKLTQKELANILNVSERHYQNIEYGIRKGSFDIWDKLEDLFQIPQRQLRENQQLDGNPATLHQNDTIK